MTGPYSHNFSHLTCKLPFKARQRSKRIARFIEQGGKCFYCQLDMFEPGIETALFGLIRLIGFPAYLEDWKIRSKKNNFGQYTNKQKKFLESRMSTLEHLHRKVDGGTRTWDNVAAACQSCNSKRQNRSVNEHKTIMSGEKLNV